MLQINVDDQQFGSNMFYRAQSKNIEWTMKKHIKIKLRMINIIYRLCEASLK